MPESILLRNISLEKGFNSSFFKLCLAPMVGLTHIYMRRRVRSYLPWGTQALWPTEMLNSNKLPNQTLGETPETLRDDDEAYLIPQILGNDEAKIQESVSKLEAWGAHGIDINMGCPVQKALRHNYGVALMGDIEYAAKVVEITRKSTRLPVSVKLRSGFGKDRVYLKDFMQALGGAGANWLTLHPRSAQEKRRGQAEWDEIKFIKSILDIPLIGNGDVQCESDVFAMFNQTNCDLVMVGRALTARPWLFWQVGETLGLKPPILRAGQCAPRGGLEEGAEFGRMLIDLTSDFKSSSNPDLALRQLRFFVKVGSAWLEFGHTLTAALSRAKSLYDANTMITQFFQTEQRMFDRTNLR